MKDRAQEPRRGSISKRRVAERKRGYPVNPFRPLKRTPEGFDNRPTRILEAFVDLG